MRRMPGQVICYGCCVFVGDGDFGLWVTFDCVADFDPETDIAVRGQVGRNFRGREHEHVCQALQEMSDMFDEHSHEGFASGGKVKR